MHPQPRRAPRSRHASPLRRTIPRTVSRTVSRPLLLTASALLLALVLGLPLQAADAATTAGLPSSSQVFHGEDDRPLPFTEDELLDFLRTADVVDSVVLATGINGARKLTLERDGVRAHAVFRSVDRSLRETTSANRPNRYAFRDCYRFEVAAYRLSRMLGIHRVPPTVLRSLPGVDGALQAGSLQLWIENARTAAEAVAEGLALQKPAERHLQRQLMYAFDQLIFNFDRHMGNLLYDRRDRMWFIDHTRSFKQLPQLSQTQRPVITDPEFHAALQALDREALRRQMDGILTRVETDALMKRRNLLLRHFEELIAERGEASVLVDLDRVRTVRSGTETARAGSEG